VEEDENDSERHEGDDSEAEEDKEIANWVWGGQYGFINPQDQFEADDEFDRIREELPGPTFMSRWRHRLIAAWRMIRHWLVGWL
jgi:hypothetical protein